MEKKALVSGIIKIQFYNKRYKLTRNKLLISGFIISFEDSSYRVIDIYYLHYS